MIAVMVLMPMTSGSRQRKPDSPGSGKPVTCVLVDV